MAANISVKVPVSFDLIAAIKNDKAPVSRSLLDKAGAAVIDAVKALPLTTSPNSTDLEFSSSAPTKTIAAMPIEQKTIVAPGRPISSPFRVFTPNERSWFSLRVSMPNGTMSTQPVCGFYSVEDLAKKVKDDRPGYLVLSNKDVRIYDERWEDDHAAASKLTLDELLIGEDSVVHAHFALNPRGW